MNIRGVYELNTKSNAFFCDGAQQFTSEEVQVCAANATDTAFAEKLAEEYLRDGANCAGTINDMFLAVVYDRRDHSIHIFSDITTSQWNMYYTVSDGVLHYSTSLRELLLASKIERRINIRAAKAFLANGYVFGKDTLIDGVYKLTFGCEITAENGEVVQRPYSYVLEDVGVKQGKKTLLSAMQKSVLECLDADGDIFMPLSGGFDSNMILDTVRKHTDRKVQAFTVGGQTGKSEIAAVQQNVAHTKNVELHTETVDESFFEKFSDIVWRLEGCVFESGVFLQYALAMAASRAGAAYLLCGEGSDEVQSKYYGESLRRVLDGTVDVNERFFTYAAPFVGTNIMILKKSSVMLNSFGITGRYPFKTRRVAVAAKAVAKLNGTKKKYYKAQCRKAFAPAIAQNLKTTGGTTGSSTAVSAEQIAFLKTCLENDELLQRISCSDVKIYATDRTKQLRRKQMLERTLDEIKGGGFKKAANSFTMNKKSKGASAVLKNAYLVLFDELFISGKYDDCFVQAAVPSNTSQILEKREEKR